MCCVILVDVYDGGWVGDGSVDVKFFDFGCGEFVLVEGGMYMGDVFGSEEWVVDVGCEGGEVVYGVFVVDEGVF